MKLQIEVVCPDCCSVKIVKNGVKRTGKQNLLCRDCKRQFQCEYRNKGSDLQVKEKLLRMLLRGSGVRDCMAVLGVSFCCVLAAILREGKDLEIKPMDKKNKRVQVDEQKLKKVDIEMFCTDNREAFRDVLPAQSHVK